MPQTRRRHAQTAAKQADSIEPAAVAEIEPTEQEPALKVSVIMVAHNRAAALRRAIEALERSQDRERIEILVVDCGSQDESPQLDTDYPDITMLRLPHNFGATKAMNIATRTAKAEILFYLSPDVEVATDTVAKLAEHLEAETDAAAAGPLLVDPEGRVQSKVREIPTRETFAIACRGGALPGAEVDPSQYSVEVEYPAIEALMIRKQFIKGMNFFDERFGEFWADADLAMQIGPAQKKARIYSAIRAVLHPAPDPVGGDALLAADRAGGAAAFLGKYQGFMAGLTFRIGAALRALGRFDFRQFTALVSGSKLDGSQAM
jgi:glycosyltransferase involved in cell wall biosynthesis